MDIRFLPAGERGLVVEFGNEISVEINDHVRTLAFALEAASIPGLIEIVPTYRSLGVEYDPLTTSPAEIEARVRGVAARADRSTLKPPKLIHIPTVYGGTYGPDLSFVARHAGLSEDEVIRLHSQATYHVYMIGFTAGFAYLGGLPESLHTPRLPSPRIKTPKGSVAIGGNQTGAYPAETPGGWRIIGRTYLDLFDPTQEIPTPMVAGDKVQFVPISEAEFLEAVTRQPGTGHPQGGVGIGREPGTESPAQDDRRPETDGGHPSPVDGRPLIEVLRSGLLTTVQDRGRIGYQRFGVPVSGAVDAVALRVGNILVGNPQGAAALEITAFGPQLRFLADVVVALTGAQTQADLDGRAVPWYQSFLIRAGQTLDIRICVEGLRAYLAVAGGLDVPILLGSRSTCLVAHFGGVHGRALSTGDVLPVGPPPGPLEILSSRATPDASRPISGSPVRVRVVWGPQEDAFTQDGRRIFLESSYRVTQDLDRMGCRLDGPQIAHRHSPDIISDWVPMGGIQVPGDGKPIILLADRQTTGGYTKIATVIGPDLGLVAQCRPGDVVQFRVVSLAQAEAIVRGMESALAALPERLQGPESWTYAAELGEVPGKIPVALRDLAPPAAQTPTSLAGENAIRSPLPALVTKVMVTPGGRVAAGQPLVVLQAMKMEHQVMAPRAGRVVNVHVREGDTPGAGDLLVTLDPGS